MIILGVQFEFKVNWASIFTLLMGMLLGMFFLVMYYLLISLKKVQKKDVIVSNEALTIESKDIIQDIEDAKKKFLDLRKEANDTITWENIKNVNVELIVKIASRFYPNSKQPVAELTFEELILLDRYIMDKLEDLLDKTGIKMLKKFKLSTALKLLNVKQEVDKNPVVKASKKMKLDKVWNVTYTVINALNPATWFKKLVFNPAIAKITKNICLVLISIIGQETYHVYSKQAFMDPYSDEEMDSLIRLINEQNLMDDEQSIKKDEIKYPDVNLKPHNEEITKEDKEIEDLNYLLNQTNVIHSKSIFDKMKKKKKKKIKN